MESHWATLRRYSPERAFEQIVAPQWEAFCGEGFERLCRETLPLLYAKEGVSGHFVGLRADGGAHETSFQNPAPDWYGSIMRRSIEALALTTSRRQR